MPEITASPTESIAPIGLLGTVIAALIYVFRKFVNGDIVSAPQDAYRKELERIIADQKKMIDAGTERERKLGETLADVVRRDERLIADYTQVARDSNRVLGEWTRTINETTRPT